LSASVAHEINNPISGVLNLSMLMQRLLKEDGVPAERLAEFRKYLSQVVNETTRVGRIVSDLLAFSRRAKPQSTKADINAIIRTTVSLVSHKLKLGNVEVRLNLADDLPVVHGDASQMQQVILNLVMNGAEASIGRPERKVAITTRWETATDSVVVDVTDNGEGIAPGNLPKIFDPFFTTKGEGKGVGLGLAVVYGIVDAHNGEITVKSTPGNGTTFTVTVPVTGTGKDDAGAPLPAGGTTTPRDGDGTGRTA
jgi:signal transduction histidine kinase